MASLIKRRQVMRQHYTDATYQSLKDLMPQQPVVFCHYHKA